MIDFIRFEVPAHQYNSHFLNDNKYNFIGRYDRTLGKHFPPYECLYKGFKIKVGVRQITISGSIHKFYNLIKGHGKHNHDDFSFSNFKESLDLLAYTLKVDLEDCKVQSLEFGVNINLDRCPSRFLNENLIVMNNKEPKMNEDFGGKGTFKEFEFAQYFMKIYDKGKQYGCSENILRIEVKTRRSEVTSKDFVYLSDMSTLSNLRRLKEILLSRTEELVICDNINKKEIMETSDLNKLTLYSNPKHWIKKSETKGDYNHTRTLRRNLKEFRTLQKKYHCDIPKNEILKKVEEKINELMVEESPQLVNFEH